MAKETKETHSEIYDLSNKIARSTVAVIVVYTIPG